MLLFFISLFLIVHGQLSIEELFSFNSKYTSTGNCTNFQSTFPNFRTEYNDYNQLIFDCNSSSLILRNTQRIPSSFCPDNENYFHTFRIHFHRFSQTSIQVNQLYLHGIELCSLDDFIQKTYSEYSYYRSERALLINLENNNNNNTKQEQQHLAIATNDEMTFILFIVSSEDSTTLSENQIDLIFPNENIFRFSQLSINVWRIDQGYIHIPNSLENTIIYQLSKSKFTLFNNETFLLYGIEISNPRRLSVYIDKTPVTCTYDDILECTFPILPLDIHDLHKPLLRVVYNLKNIFHANLTLNLRTRLGQASTYHSLTEIATYKVNIDTNLCTNDSLKSVFTLIIHLQTEDINGTRQYHNITPHDIGPIDCKTTAEIGQAIDNLIKPTPITDILSLNVDLIHQWDDHRDCQAERTRITFF